MNGQDDSLKAIDKLLALPDDELKKKFDDHIETGLGKLVTDAIYGQDDKKPEPASRDTTFDGVVPKKLWLCYDNGKHNGPYFKFKIEINGIEKEIMSFFIPGIDQNEGHHCGSHNLTWIIEAATDELARKLEAAESIRKELELEQVEHIEILAGQYEKELAKERARNAKRVAALEEIAGVVLHENTLERRLREWQNIAKRALKD